MILPDLVIDVIYLILYVMGPLFKLAMAGLFVGVGIDAFTHALQILRG